MKSILFLPIFIFIYFTPSTQILHSYKIDTAKWDTKNNQWYFEYPIPLSINVTTSDTSISFNDSLYFKFLGISRIENKESYLSTTFKCLDTNGYLGVISFTYYKKIDLHTVDVSFRNRCFVLFIK